MNIALKALGTTPVGMPVSELAVSLQKGVVDGALTPYSAYVDFKIYDLLKYVMEVNLYGTYMIMIMNKKSFDSLSEIGKKAIEQASGKQWGLHVAKDVPMYSIFRGIVPFIFAMLFLIALLLIFPQIALYLPHTMSR